MMSDVRSGRDPRSIPTSFQNRPTAKSRSPERRPVTQDQGPRSRSLSPVKKSPTTFGLSSHLSDARDFVDNASSTSAMSREQLMLLSQTPLSDTLHITRNDYAIPIPFKLRMPPKLAPPDSSHSSSTSPAPSGNHIHRHLIFNGTNYEPMNYDSSFQYGSRPASPEKPPATVSNNKKVARFVQKTSTIPADQLSLIEEKSLGGGSRVPSSKVKGLPLLPDEEATTDEILPIGNINRYSFPSLDQVDKKQEFNTLNNSRSRISRDESINKPQPPPRTVSSSLVANGAKFQHDSPYSQLQYQAAMANKEPGESLNIDNIQTGTEIQSRPGMQTRSNLPSSTTFHHNMYMAPSELKIGKRTFSDESCVSSVSSFSSVGDILNFNHAYMSSPNERGEIRVTSDVINYLETAKLSRHSSYKAPSPPRQTQSPTRSQVVVSNSSQTIKSPLPRKLMNQADEVPDTQTGSVVQKDSEHSQREISQSSKNSPQKESPKDNLTIDDGPTEPLVLQNKRIKSAGKTEKAPESPLSRIQSSTIEDNNGAGAGFNFPNNATNATNSDKARKRAKNQRAYKKSTSFSSHFSNGQIEISELLESMMSDNSKTAGTTVEPLGVPSAAAVSHLKGLYGESSFDSDSEGSFNSQFHALQAKQALNSQTITASKSHDVLSPQSHPLKNSHSRHRSMYNIDFDHDDFVNSSPSKTRPMSMNLASTEIADMSRQLDSLVLTNNNKIDIAPVPQSTFKTPIKINSSKQVISPTENTQNESPEQLHKEEELNIKVAEAPKKVRYPVDFKDKGSKVQAPYGKRTNYYNDVNLKKFQPLREYNTPSKSDIASSYNSSRTGQYTESTAPTDSDSVVIDLTKESYDICMINRKDSTTSYKSVIEKTRDGKNVEIVLVEEDDDVMNRSYERDDLSSIYSHYISGWDESFRQKDRFVPDLSPYRHMQLPTQSIRQASRMPPRQEMPKFSLNELSKTNLNHLDVTNRKHSNGSIESETSEASANSWIPSETNFRVKPIHNSTEQFNKHPENTFVKSKGVLREPQLSIDRVPVKQKIQEPSSARHSNHFDYHTNGNYDFNSFMLQTKH